MNNRFTQNNSRISSSNESDTLFAYFKKPCLSRRLLIKSSSIDEKSNSDLGVSSGMVPVNSVAPSKTISSKAIPSKTIPSKTTSSKTPSKIKSTSPQPSVPAEKKPLENKVQLTLSKGESFAQTNQSSSQVEIKPGTPLINLKPSPFGERRMPEKKAPLKGGSFGKSNRGSSRVVKKRVLSLSQILSKQRFQRKKKMELLKRRRPIKPIIPPKSLIIVLKEKPENGIYNRRLIDYKHCGLLQRYIGLGGKILARRQTRLTAKQQRYVAKTIKSARIMGLLPFVSRERGFFR